MAKVSLLEEQLGRARALREKGIGEVTDAEILGLLGSKFGLVAARGAEMAGEGKREGLIPELVKMFARFLKDGEKTDKGCAAKFAAINALCALDHRDHELYRRGMKVVQREASFGPRLDTAAEMRGRCAVALAECGAPGAMLDIVEMLVEEEAVARVGAARAMGAFGSQEAAAVLRLKMLTGDDEPVVLAECCLGLLHISVEEHGEYVVEFLRGAEEGVAVDFLTALTESRDGRMLEMVQEVYRGAEGSGGFAVRRAALGAAALMRVDGGIEFLLEVVEKEIHARAREGLEALRARGGEERVRARIEAALGRRGDEGLWKIYRAGFGVE